MDSSSPLTRDNTSRELAVLLARAESAYSAANTQSASRYEQACEVMPGGNTRSVLYFSPFPLCMVRGEGCRLWDADDHQYIDLLAEFTAGIFGHSNPSIRAAIDAALDDGLNLSSHNHLEAQLARVICERFPSIDQVRFTNSGTEANLMALAAAKAFTGRSKILTFEGAYHGGVLAFPPGGSAVNVPHDFVVAPYNEADETSRLLGTAGDQLAAVLIEPMLGAGGCIPAELPFLEMLRTETRRRGAILIFDEVMTSRLSPGGRQALVDIVPDMTTLGKYIGGGMAFGAFGGRADIMAQFDPRRPTSLAHAGTFNNNTITMAAGLAGMTSIFTRDRCLELNARGDGLRDSLNALFAAQRVPLRMTGLGSVMNLHATGSNSNAIRDLIFFDLVARGFYLARRGLIALSLPITDAETNAFLKTMTDIVAARHDVLRA